jgi:hypothetical protein
VATIRERRPGVWEVRVFVGEDVRGRPKQVSRTVRGTKRAAQKLAAELTVVPPPPSDGHRVADSLDAWLETNTPTWAASTMRDQTSRVLLVKADKIARVVVDRLSAADVDRWTPGCGSGASAQRRSGISISCCGRPCRWLGGGG